MLNKYIADITAEYDGSCCKLSGLEGWPASWPRIPAGAQLLQLPPVSQVTLHVTIDNGESSLQHMPAYLGRA